MKSTIRYDVIWFKPLAFGFYATEKETDRQRKGGGEREGGGGGKTEEERERRAESWVDMKG